jgi:pimeloyl-ACP methyl ester carboxylesterase
MLPLLKRVGHEVIAPDLPGLGKDITPLNQISLEFWTESISELVVSQPNPVVLVGHSNGGAILSSVAEKCPKKVARLVYVTAALVRDGESLRQLLVEDGTSLLLPNLVLADDGNSSTVREEALKAVFYGESPEEDIALARLLLRPEPRGPAGTPIHITEENFGSVPRFYIECLRDKVIPQSLQKKMYSALPCQKVMTIDTDHSPFFSAPQRLAECLLSIDPQRGNAA